ncbi:MAG: hypothetical protein K2X98_01075, partial [Alphaproteobacteria bacterium]|nr:hypothetical protein [Alphaproteobacteria bacterium]
EGKAKKERKLIEQFFGRHRNIDMLLNMIRDVAMLSVPIDGDNSFAAMTKKYLAKKFEDMETIPSLESLFGAIDLNIKLLAQERKTMGIRDGDFKYFLRARESLEHALAEWERKHKPIIMDSVPAPAAPVLDAQAPKAEVVDSQQGVDVPKKMLTEPKNHATTPEAVTTIDAPHNTLMNDSSSDHDQGMDAFVYTSEYFQKEHSYHQQRKKSASPSSTQHQLSTYETDLYTLLKDRIYRPAGHRPTWAEIVEGLGKLGFSGAINKNANGSTWVFSVTDKNELFFHNDAYKGATFNVHKYPVDNEPMNLSYLMFFKSGLTNVFGLSEEYVMEQLSRDTSNLKTGVIVKK